MPTQFYAKSDLGERVPDKIMSLLKKTGVILPNDQVEAVLGSTSLWGINSCLVATQNALIYFCNSGVPFNKRFAYSGITSIDVMASNIIGKIAITVGGANAVATNILGEVQELQCMVDFVLKKMDAVASKSAENSLSPSDEIAKYHALKEQGIITEDEFNQKKKQLLNL